MHEITKKEQREALSAKKPYHWHNFMVFQDSENNWPLDSNWAHGLVKVVRWVE